MGFVKTYNIDGKWIEGKLTDNEEEQAMENCRRHQRNIMDESIEDAYTFIKSHPESGQKTQDNIINIAITFFKKRANSIKNEREKLVRQKLGV
jgi:hypothetical protein